jgi:hypothetical protein
MFSHAQFGRRLLHGIPRLSSVSRMIEHQHDTFTEPTGLPAEERSVALGSQMLRVALDFIRLRGIGVAAGAALVEMREDRSQYNPDVLAALGRVYAEVGETDLVTEECLAPETVPSDHQLFRPVAEQVLRALRT